MSSRQSLRWTVCAIAAAAFRAARPDLVDLPLMLSIAVIALSLSVRAPISLRNLFCVYTFGIFVVGNRLLFPRSPDQNQDLLLYLCCFMLPYLARSLLPLANRRGTTAMDGAIPAANQQRSIHLERALLGLIGVQLARFLVLAAPYGLAGIYSGRGLAGRIESYSRTGNAGFEQLSGLLLLAAVAGVAIAYFEDRLWGGLPVRFGLLGVSLLLFPLLAFERAFLVYGVILFGAMYLFDRSHRRFARGKHVRLKARSNSGRRVVVAGLLSGAVIFVAINIGDVRAQELERTPGVTGQGDTLEQVLRGEFTPIQFYRDSKDNIDELGYRGGTNIVGAFVTRLVPRSVWKNKPITTQEYYMRQLYPAQLSQGYSLAPSLFGVGFLNFGLAGTGLLCLSLGFLASGLDRAYMAATQPGLSHFLIVATWSYSVLRDDLATSMASIALTYATYVAVRFIFSARILGGEGSTSSSGTAGSNRRGVQGLSPASSG